MSDLVSRLRMRLDRTSGMSNLDEVVLKYGHANGKRWSFEEHEFQMEIIKDTSSRIAVRKCSQVGLSEVMVQKLLAMAASLNHVRIIFTLPTKEMAIAFSKDRIDGAIDQSDFYSGMVQAAANSASQKKIGSCVVYVSGSFGSNSAISVPAEVIINDEVDFSNQVVLGKLTSRLRHAQIVDEHGQRGLQYQFSTPTVKGYGIDAQFQLGTQKYYMCKCKSCGEWNNPQFVNDFVIPGFDNSMDKFDRAEALLPKVRLDEAKILCSKCRTDLFSSLIDPSCREWVGLFPDRIKQSYQVNPWDVPTYNTPAEIARQIIGYPLKSDFYNFVLGLPYSDADNSFLTEDAYKLSLRTVDPLPYLASMILNATVMGMDIGKTCHLTVAIPMGSKFHIIWAEKITNSKEMPAAPQVLARFDFFQCAFMCIDSMPDITLVNTLLQARSNIHAVVYVNNLAGPNIFEEKSDQIINVARTKSLSFLLDKHNSGEIQYPKSDEIIDEMFQHLDTTKKIRRQNADGTFTESFQATSPTDHWVHSIHYVMLAAEIRFGMGQASIGISAPVGVSKVIVGENHKVETDNLAKKYIW